MKMNTKSFGFLLTLALFVAACKPDLKEIGPDAIPGDGIYGSWEIAQVVQTDLKTPIPESRNVTAFVTSNPTRTLQLRMNKEGNTYDVLQQGVLPKVLGTGGTWQYDQTPYPTKINFFTSYGDTVSAPLKNMVRDYDPQLGFDIIRKDSCGTAYLKYEYTFKRID
jgi:hypothetical protein